MLGSLRHGRKFYETRHPDPDDLLFPSKSTRNGLTVKTSLIPGRELSFFWTT
jgi:hypothetical protein